MIKVLIFLLIILVTGCSNNLYPNQNKRKHTPRVEIINKEKIKRQIRNFSNCGIFKKY